MRNHPQVLRTLCLAIGFAMPASLTAETAPLAVEAEAVVPPRNVSLQKEVRHAIDKGLAWLPSRQDPSGAWSSTNHPALTALALTALMENPSRQARIGENEVIRKGYAFLLGCVQPDGGIYRRDLPNYNTAISMMALLAANEPRYEPVLRQARVFLIGQQKDLGVRGKQDTPWDGSMGYGENKERHGDMSNMLMALEALYYTRHFKMMERETAPDLDWPAAIAFIQRCQNLPSVNKEAWASDDPENKGGFIYCPNHSMAGEMKLPAGRTALRSYGSMSYAGLLSYIYADLKPDDPRVVAVFEWLRNHYSVEENPGMKADGLFYYYHTMAKGLATRGVDRLRLSDGRLVSWREDLAKKMINLQKSDGFWVNESGRWWEKDPVLVTAYALITLEIIHRGL